MGYRVRKSGREIEMREIKFRFWDKAAKQMYEDNPSFAIGCNGEVSQLLYHYGDDGDCVEWEGTFYSKHIIPLEYTGLKDKNGKEIFEGDIVQEKETNSTFKFIVIYDHCGYKLERGTTSKFHRSIVESSWLEVIGNIYENPELMEVEKC